MIFYNITSTEPYFNLASEQFLLDSDCSDDIFMLWQNEPCVVIGRSQNAYSEINGTFVRENNIKVVRRLTGGGAVFHDLGNVNFTCITPKERIAALDFGRFMQPVVDALRSLGVPAEISGRNDITAEGFKVSGNAQCVYNGKLMHHGTLLFSADMSFLSGALNVNQLKIQSKGIKSIRSRVKNIADYVPGLSVEDFRIYLAKSLGGGKDVDFSASQKSEIDKLVDTKYSTWEWNFGASKSFSTERTAYFPFGLIEIGYNSDHGTITDIEFKGDFFGVKPVDELEKSLVGVRLEYNALCKAFENIGEYINGARADALIGLIL